MNKVKNKNEIEKQNGLPKTDETLIYTLAHDIKSPINHVEGLILIAKRMNDNAELDSILQLALTANRNLSNKVNELLDMNVREKNKEEVDFRELVNDLWDTIYTMRQVEDIKMVHLCQLHDGVMVDKTRLKSILQNLMENAIKYRKKDTDDHSILIRSFISDNRFVIKVTDNGIGMTSEHLDKVFKPSYQADATHEGHGMGLYLALRNASNMGGELSVDSKWGQGTTFTLDLPHTTN